LLQLKNNVSEM